MPSVHCVTRSRAKLTMMRGENCTEVSVSVISTIANTNGHHRHYRRPDARENNLSDLWISPGREERFGHPGAEGRERLFQPRQERARTTQRQCDGQRTNQKSAAQVIHDMAKQQWQSSAHGLTLTRLVL